MRPLFFSFSPLDFFIKPFMLSFSSCLSPSTMVSVCSASLRLLCLFLSVWFCFFFLSFVSVNVVDAGVILTFSKQISFSLVTGIDWFSSSPLSDSTLTRPSVNWSPWLFRFLILSYASLQVFNLFWSVYRRKFFEVNREAFPPLLLIISKNYFKDEVRRSSLAPSTEMLICVDRLCVPRQSWVWMRTIELESDSI